MVSDSAPFSMRFRVHYGDTDQMGTYQNARALEWFEHGRTESMRGRGLSYREMEERGIRLPVVEAHVIYQGRAVYDDELVMTVAISMPSKARFRFDITIKQAETGEPVCHGWTTHGVTNATGKPIRPPQWMIDVVM